jgi:serine/threonine protein kinase
MVAVVIGFYPFENTSYVDGILLQYCSKGSIKRLLQRSEPPISSARKRRWAAQIAHGISNIHKAGLLHGDLRCENVVVDENDDAYVADLTNGTTVMLGWHAELDDLDDPRRDVYGLGVTIWELIHDGDSARYREKPLHIDERGQEYKKEFTSLVEESVVEIADKRISLDKMMQVLGCYDACGCQGEHDQV